MIKGLNQTDVQSYRRTDAVWRGGEGRGGDVGETGEEGRKGGGEEEQARKERNGLNVTQKDGSP